MVPLYIMHIVSIKSKLLWERETDSEGELLYVSSELCQKKMLMATTVTYSQI